MVFRPPVTVRRTGRVAIPRRSHLPPFARQQERLDEQLDMLRQAFEAKRAAWQSEITGASPEEVLVFETVGTITDFQAAVRRIDGLDWLAEWEDEEIAPDEEFYADDEHPDKPLGGTLFLFMTNQAN